MVRKILKEANQIEQMFNQFASTAKTSFVKNFSQQIRTS